MRAQVLVLARSLFEKTDAVVRADNVARGIQHMLSAELPWGEERKRRGARVRIAASLVSGRGFTPPRAYSRS